MRFLDKTIPVNENVIWRLNEIFDIFIDEWNKCAKGHFYGTTVAG